MSSGERRSLKVLGKEVRSHRDAPVLGRGREEGRGVVGAPTLSVSERLGDGRRRSPDGPISTLPDEVLVPCQVSGTILRHPEAREEDDDEGHSGRRVWSTSSQRDYEPAFK